MFNTDYIKKAIEKCILSGEEEIIYVHRSTDLFESLLKEKPALLWYINSWSKRTVAVGMEHKVSYNVKYHNQDVLYKDIVVVKSNEELERALHNHIGAYKLSLSVVAVGRIDVNKVYRDFMLTYGGYYSNLERIEYKNAAFTTLSVNIAAFEFTYRIGRIKLGMMEAAVDKEIERLEKILFSPDMLPETKAYIAHNYLAKTVTYWQKIDPNPLEMSYKQSAYGAFINHKCVCQGYAEAYKKLLNSQGIICEVLCGVVKKSGEHHAWNLVSFDGRKYYHVDVTWDSYGEGRIGWDYCFLSDKKLIPERIWSRLPEYACVSDVDIINIARNQLRSKGAIYVSRGIDKNYF